jgi:hypothetical protein
MKKLWYFIILVAITTTFAITYDFSNAVTSKPAIRNDSYYEAKNSSDMNEEKRIIENYLKASREKNDLYLKKLVTKMPKSYWRYFTKKYEKVDFDSLEKEEYRRGDSTYEETLKDYPEYVRKYKLVFREISGTWINKRAGRLRVVVDSELPESARNDSYYPKSWDFYIFKDEDEEWRIFMILYPDSEDQFPNL